MTERSLLRRLIRASLAALLLAALLAGGAYLYWDVFEHRFLAIAEGKLYQSGAMPLDRLARKIEKHGIRTIIDLRRGHDEVRAEREALAALGVEHVHLPSAQIPSAEVVESFLQYIGREENHPVLIHCEHGEGRSAMLAAIYRIEFEGWSPDRARRAARFLPFRGSFSPGRRKGQYLLNYVPRRQQGTRAWGNRP
jgi:protein tyrosine/serine phosphatase